MLKKLALASVISANIGYTLLLLPLLNALYGRRIPLSPLNVAAFILVDSLGGVVIAILTYALTRTYGLRLAVASATSISVLWAAYWLVASLATGAVDVPVLCVDGLAAAVTWTILNLLMGVLGHSWAVPRGH